MRVYENLHKYMLRTFVNRRKECGLTLIELIASLALLSIVLTITFSFMNTSNNFLGMNSRRSDAQAQLRVIMMGLKNEVSTAATVKITTNSSITLGSSERMFYSGITSSNSYSLLLKTTSSITSAFSNLPLKSFNITFSSNNTSPKILTVTMTTSEGYSLTGDILAPNVSNIPADSGGILSGNTLVCTPAS